MIIGFSIQDCGKLLVAFSDAPGAIRTHDPRIRNPMLYPAELRGRIGKSGTYEPVSECSKLMCAPCGKTVISLPLFLVGWLGPPLMHRKR